MGQGDSLKVLCVLPVLGQPRHAKRIAMLQESGCAVEAIAFERDYHRARLPDCPVQIMGKIQHGNYGRRLLHILAALPALRKAIRRHQVVFAFGPDLALMSLLAGIGLKKPIILEIGDLTPLQVHQGMLGRVARFMDKLITTRCALLVVTSEGYIKGYYQPILQIQTPYLVLENKLERAEELAPKAIAARPDRPLTIGYFGLLRCEWSWLVLEKLAAKYPDKIRIILAGYLRRPVDLLERIAKLPNVEFRGEYRSPQDLPNLYRDIDLVWNCYPPNGEEPYWRWLRANRFYEGCFFKKPLVVLEECGDAAIVEAHDLGPLVNRSDIDAVIERLANVTQGDLMRWQRNMFALDESLYLYTHEVDELKAALQKIAPAHS